MDKAIVRGTRIGITNQWAMPYLFSCRFSSCLRAYHGIWDTWDTGMSWRRRGRRIRRFRSILSCTLRRYMRDIRIKFVVIFRGREVQSWNHTRNYTMAHTYDHFIL